jgi:hypothetical protein
MFDEIKGKSKRSALSQAQEKLRTIPGSIFMSGPTKNSNGDWVVKIDVPYKMPFVVGHSRFMGIRGVPSIYSEPNREQ